MAGMGDESIELSKLGTALFAFGFVLVISLGIFTVGKSITNSGSDKVTTQLDTVEQSEFEDYDQQTILGTKVKAAYSNFEGKPYAIVITTRSMLDKGGKLSSGISGVPGMTQATADTAVQLNGLAAYNGISSEPMMTYEGVNYNAQLASPDGGQAKLTLKNGAFVTTGDFKTIEGNIQYYNQVSNMKRQGTGEFIPTGAKYMSSLIKDSTGSTCGVAFVQTSSN